MLRCARVLYFGEHTLCCVARVCFRWTRFMLRCAPFFFEIRWTHVTLRTSVALRWTHFMLRCADMLYFGEDTLHVTFRAYVSIPCTHFMLRCARTLYFGDQTSRYVACFCLSSVTKTSCCVARFCWSNTLHAALRGCAVLRWTRCMLRCARVCFSSVNTLHVSLRECAVLQWPNFTLRCTLLLYFGEHTSCYAARFCCTSVNMLRCARMLYFRERASCYAARVCFNSVNALHAARVRLNSVNALYATLRACFVIPWAHFMLRCTLLPYFGEHAPCYVAHVCCTSVNTLHVTLRTSVVLRWARFMLRCARVLYTSVNTLHVASRAYVLIRWTHFALRCAFGEHTSCFVACMRFFFLIRCHEHTSCMQVEAMEKNRWRFGETKNDPKNVKLFEGVQHAFLNCHCNKTRIVHNPNGNEVPKDTTMI